MDLHSGIPGIDIVGLPDGALKEARERVRVAIRNSGFTFFAPGSFLKIKWLIRKQKTTANRETIKYFKGIGMITCGFLKLLNFENC